jgi:hypothetical protein
VRVAARHRARERLERRDVVQDPDAALSECRGERA